MQKEFKQLTSFPFLVCLFILLLNDLFLKAYFHNYFTGKLSDFCGLFIFPIFWSILFPKKKGVIFFCTVCLYTFWKSPYSQEIICLFSNYIFPIQRVVDISDLTALLILPFAWKQLSLQSKSDILNPWVAGLLTVFSFCATSIAKPVQTFEQPQYILLESPSFFPDTSENYQYFDDFKYFKFDSLVAIDVNSIRIKFKPAKDDDFQKNQILKNLDDRVIAEINASKPGGYYLNMPKGIHKLTIVTSEYIDTLNFKGSRLNGSFVRVNSSGKIVIQGRYKNGIEDSIWTFTDSVGNTFTKKTFVNGESVRLERYEDIKRISSKRILRRSETVRNKYFHIAILLVLVGGLLTLIVRNYRSLHPEKIRYSTLGKIIYCFTLPFAVTVSILIISDFIPDAFSANFKVIGDLFLSYMVTLPLFLIAFFGIKIRKKIDILWYILLFALLINIVQEIIQLNRLLNIQT